MLSETLRPRLRELYGEQFSIGCDSGIYWKHTEPVLDGCKAPDWFLVPGVSPMLNGQIRRSYVLWKEGVRPLIVIEYVSGDGSEERDTTPEKGKKWVYENPIGATYYVIFDPQKAEIEAYELVRRQFQLIKPTTAGRVPIPDLRIELGIWEGKFHDMEGAWLRPWDAHTGQMMSLAEERAESAEAALDETRGLLDEQTERTQKLAAKLREMGIDPDTL